ncbi:DNA helicase RecQ [Lactobacillus terrae]|uniref:DNA helicase RecQ n=1 Tax=Lactobacillus terrae TaxID=2269374 RepID=UPI000C1B634D|nr:DNA helicase RecQ [Lactobacillus terrae]
MLEPEQILKTNFGYDQFRTGQLEIINRVMAGKRTIGIMPTGGGKSVCYQIPALMFSGITLVISPLISLMKDQVDGLNEMNIPATFFNSTLDYIDMSERMRYVESGAVKLIYAAPERIENTDFYGWLSSLPIDLVAIDEAHVLSSWGHDFRPSYLAMVNLINQLPAQPNVLALTATATNSVQTDLAHTLNVSDDNIITTGFERDNLALTVEKSVRKLPYILRYAKEHKDQSGIVYVGRRKDVDRIYEYLNDHGIKAGKYHAGMSDEDRKNEQERFLFDEVDVIIATNAFGMGINKTNVRYVIHYSMPGTIENYYQEIGRAGRDGLPSEAVLLYSPADIHLHLFFIEKSEADEEYKQSLNNKLQNMNQLATTEMCLMKYILQYFGETNYDKCGKCSNCTDVRESIDVTKTTQMVLSCIIRMDQSYGKKSVARVLVGKHSLNKNARDFSHLSTYGLLKDKSLKEVEEFIDYALSSNYIEMTSDQYPVLKVTQEGLEILKSNKKTYKKVSKKAPAVNNIKIADGTFDEGLFQELRRIRLTIAHAQDIPPFVIFSDNTLKEMAQKQPVSSSQFLEISGVGDAKLDRYGKRFMEVISEYVSA